MMICYWFELLATFYIIISFKFGLRQFHHHKGKGTQAGQGSSSWFYTSAKLQVNLKNLSQGKTESCLILPVSEKHDKSLIDWRHPWVITDHKYHKTIKFENGSQHTSFKRGKSPCIYGHFFWQECQVHSMEK